MTNYRAWTDEEVRTLEDNYYEKGVEVDVDRTKKAIRQKASRLNLKTKKGKEKVSINKIKKLYQRGLSQKEVAEKLGIKQTSVSERMDNHGIETRYSASEGEERRKEVRKKISESLKGKFSGEKNPNWKGGKNSKSQKYGREFCEELKEKIRQRDGRECSICGKTSENNSKDERRLAVHHIDGNKNNNKKSNLVTLCIGCNVKIEKLGVRPEFEATI